MLCIDNFSKYLIRIIFSYSPSLRGRLSKGNLLTTILIVADIMINFSHFFLNVTAIRWAVFELFFHASHIYRQSPENKGTIHFMP